MAQNKTQPTQLSVTSYIDSIEDPERRDDCKALVQLMTAVTGQQPVMWGRNIVGFGSYHYKYASGHEGDSCLTGFSSRKGDISIYTQVGFQGCKELLASLGKHKTGVACLYVRRLADVNQEVLAELLASTVADLKSRLP